MKKNSKKTYDLIFSIGQACSCTEALRAFGLQKFSYPFDWLYGTDFTGRVNILTSNFEHFLDIEDLKHIGERTSPQPCYLYENTKTNLVFNHDFPLNIPLSESYQKAKSKYERRIKRLLNLISKAKKVLIVYMELPGKADTIEDDTIFLEAHKKISQAFKTTEFDILYLADSSNLQADEIQIKEINENITKLVLDYKNKSTSAPENSADMNILEKVFSDYQLKNFFNRKKVVEIKKLKKGLGIYLFKNIFNIMRIRCILFGCRIDFCIGKVRD